MRIHTKNFELTPAIKQAVEEKFSNALKVNINLHDEKLHVTLEKTGTSGKDNFKIKAEIKTAYTVVTITETSSLNADVYAIITTAAEKLERHLRKDKEKHEKR